MNGECNATNVQGKNYNLHKLQGGHVPQCPIAGDATEQTSSWSDNRFDYFTPAGNLIIRLGYCVVEYTIPTPITINNNNNNNNTSICKARNVSIRAESDIGLLAYLPGL